ncbi:hypothetical protein GUJ93_ZPchr0004g38158 [Zizania palustris]|uniref:Uncharacterized protein n=1 Tax=Zizania palustris TaxID=103762 RepID=A0A8J5VP71_ZIZPA|nr:hypothetical protein GUJ93_ZPchr0004g38158 [Zizania palustris]
MKAPESYPLFLEVVVGQFEGLEDADDVQEKCYYMDVWYPSFFDPPVFCTGLLQVRYLRPVLHNQCLIRSLQFQISKAMGCY